MKQRFDPSEPNKAWVCDFTYLRAAERFYYLCVILDLFSRKVIAYKLSPSLNTRLAIETLDMAVANRNVSNGVIFHSDRGCQFTSEAFRKHLDELNIVQSFSAKGHPYGKAADTQSTEYDALTASLKELAGKLEQERKGQ